MRAIEYADPRPNGSAPSEPKAYTDRLEDWNAWRKEALEYLRELTAE